MVDILGKHGNTGQRKVLLPAVTIRSKVVVRRIRFRRAATKATRRAIRHAKKNSMKRQHAKENVFADMEDRTKLINIMVSE
ncbi:unnamed protein product [Gongylonema pulchrum]|uniref:40S ribosomal protein S24 n=1 Tax=Gongylonema pulchrum TaxID=637853 RepID=A0A183DMT3_9BILA|nr:unnamed protein product [Gongylonema pulchrum]